MKTDKLSIEPKLGNLFVDVFRIFVGVLTIIMLIFLLPINPNATLVFLALLLLLFIFSAKSSIEMHDSFLLFKTNRLVTLFNSQLEINLKDIEIIDFYPKRTNWLVVLLPGFGGFQDIEYIFHLKNKNNISKKLYDNKCVVEKLNIELEKHVKLVYH